MAEITDEQIAFLNSEGYIYDKFLGDGVFGIVSKFIAPDGKSVALKLIKKNDLTNENKNKISNEITIHESLNHPNIVKLEKYSINDTYCYIVQELCSYSLEKIIYNNSIQLDENYCLKILFEIMDGINYIHEKLILHKDIKAENILVDFNGVPKITDFGNSVQLRTPDEKLNFFVGTMVYRSPETLLFRSPETLIYCPRGSEEYKKHFFKLITPSYSLPLDIWSTGVLFYELLFKELPFDDLENRDNIFRKISIGEYDINSRDISEKSTFILSRMLDVNPNSRITASELLEILI